MTIESLLIDLTTALRDNTAARQKESPPLTGTPVTSSEPAKPKKQSAKTTAASGTSESGVTMKEVADLVTAVAAISRDPAIAVLTELGVSRASELKPEQFADAAGKLKAALAKLQQPAPAAPASLI
jgi:hypothetical protein